MNDLADCQTIEMDVRFVETKTATIRVRNAYTDLTIRNALREEGYTPDDAEIEVLETRP